MQQQGKIAIKVLAREDNAERSTDVTETRKAAHILIAYKGATRAADTITRTDAEALTIANDVLKQAQEGKDFGSLVKQYSDEPGAAARSGDLGYFGRGQMAQAFEQAVFDASAPGLIQRVVRTEFGYHIITVADIKPATTTKTQETRIKLESAVFSTVPDGWASTGLTGQHFRHADVGSDPTSGRPIVNISFTDTAVAAQTVNWWQMGFALLATVAGITFIFTLLGMLAEEGKASWRMRIGVLAALLVVIGAIAGYFLTSTPKAAPTPTATSSDKPISETDKAGVELFKEITARNIKKPVAIVLDGLPIIDTNGDGVIDSRDPPYAPVVQQEIDSGKAQISGLKTFKEANDLAQNLNTGAIPAPIKLTGQYTVGASLGASALHDSLIAGFYGLIAIALFMILYYRLPGLLASLALIIYGILLVAVIQYFGLVMTLAGIAGAILSMGIAVDANVLIFERMKEELRIGKALNIAIEDGFKRAWTSIRDSNVTTLLICLILFLFGSSIVKGFAITLTIGIIISLITAVWVTRTFLRATARTALRKALFLFGK